MTEKWTEQKRWARNGLEMEDEEPKLEMDHHKHFHQPNDSWIGCSCSWINSRGKMRGVLEATITRL